MSVDQSQERQRRARPPAGDPLETQADRSHREWADNWSAVTGAVDLAALDTRSLLRAQGYGAHRRQAEHLKAQRGLPWSESLVASIDTELYAIDQVLRDRGVIGAKTRDQAAAQAPAQPARSPSIPQESAASFEAAMARIGPEPPRGAKGEATVEDLQRHLERIRRIQAAKVEALGPIDQIAIGKSASSEQWKMALPDVNGGGRWRTQTFDEDGFSGHEIFKDKATAVDELARHHYLRDDGALDRLQDTPRFQRGLFVADLVRQVNGGDITHAEADRRLAAYGRTDLEETSPAIESTVEAESEDPIAPRG